ncbi:unnamed protein product [Vitrella brassicaformis CCMP3155]|uniref:Uncharacterized protein n=2 Tax=Vitrella brassicaformis TaxID=1169539 RepID=A0A0G4EGZ3_VITBC|nr:unnamed protein product [Vitrella brassicaformis CCMP3155]|eukprot:CEL95512.1 unnamed protein product [Vitrella brassicaformis CCMP3155]
MEPEESSASSVDRNTRLRRWLAELPSQGQGNELLAPDVSPPDEQEWDGHLAALQSELQTLHIEHFIRHTEIRHFGFDDASSGIVEYVRQILDDQAAVLETELQMLLHQREILCAQLRAIATLSVGTTVSSLALQELMGEWEALQRRTSEAPAERRRQEPNLRSVKVDAILVCHDLLLQILRADKLMGEGLAGLITAKEELKAAMRILNHRGDIFSKRRLCRVGGIPLFQLEFWEQQQLDTTKAAPSSDKRPSFPPPAPSGSGQLALEGIAPVWPAPFVEQRVAVNNLDAHYYQLRYENAILKTHLEIEQCAAEERKMVHDLFLKSTQEITRTHAVGTRERALRCLSQWKAFCQTERPLPRIVNALFTEQDRKDVAEREPPAPHHFSGYTDEDEQPVQTTDPSESWGHLLPALERWTPVSQTDT